MYKQVKILQALQHQKLLLRSASSPHASFLLTLRTFSSDFREASSAPDRLADKSNRVVMMEVFMVKNMVDVSGGGIEARKN
jgi:hypothetical protein